MRHDENEVFESYLIGQVLLFSLLGAALALFLTYPDLRHTYELPELRLVLLTVTMAVAGIVAVLAGLRFSVDGRGLDLLLSTGFFVLAASHLLFSIAPHFSGDSLGRAEAWSALVTRFVGWTLIALAPFVHGRIRARERALGNAVISLSFVMAAVWVGAHALGTALPDVTPAAPGQDVGAPFMLTGVLAAQALLNLCAIVGFTWRFRDHGDDLDRWLALGATLMLFASLHYIFTPLVHSGTVSQGDFLRVLAFGVLLVGVWRAIRYSEFGRAVAEERARVAREIHDGLAQYLFAISTHASMLEADPSPATIRQLKEAAAAAQQEARFAVLALSSASGTAPFDAALRRYVEFLTADGQLEVELEIDPDTHLAPDEQIEVFRIVQEGLANVRKHAGARRAEVVIGQRGGDRFVKVRDDGKGLSESDGAGQGLKNIRKRTESIEGGLTVTSKPGFGTALEVVLRA
ncbi:MAG: histidine kinase [Actinomycetota bacterium]|nr:histidine kinase [Actinomycetota bacterium]